MKRDAVIVKIRDRTAGIAALAVVVLLAGAATAEANWQIQPVETPAVAPQGQLSAVACPSSTVCVAVGSFVDRVGITTALIEHWDGSAWAISPNGLPAGATRSTLTGVSCTSPLACTAVGYFEEGTSTPEALAERWDGASWTVQSTPSPQGRTLVAVSCASANACVAVGNSISEGTRAPLAEGWDGSTWTTEAPAGPGLGSLAGLSCTTPTTCVAVGQSVGADGNIKVLAEVRNGLQWTLRTVPTPAGTTASSLNAVSCTASSACTAVGFDIGPRKQVTLAEGWDGTSWSMQPTDSSGSIFSAVSCASGTACTAVGTAGFSGDVTENWDGTSWAAQATPSPANASRTLLAGVACPSATQCTSVGSTEVNSSYVVTLALVGNSSNWALQSTPNPAGATGGGLGGVACAGTDDCVAVGSYVNPDHVTVTLVEHWDGHRWTKQTSPNPQGASASALAAVSCPRPHTCVAVGTTSTPAQGSTPLIERWDGARWSLQSTPTLSGSYGALSGVSCANETRCTAIGVYVSGDGAQLTLAEGWDATGWTLQTTPNPSGAFASQLQGVSCPTPHDCMAVGTVVGVTDIETLAERWDGARWSIVPTSDPAVNFSSRLAGVSCVSPDVCVAVGDYNDVPAAHPGISLVERWDGTQWSVQTPSTPEGAADDAPLAAISCSHDRDCVSVGSFADTAGNTFPVAQHWDGQTWTLESVPIPAGATFSGFGAVSCSHAGTCSAVGGSSRGVVLPLAEGPPGRS